jgi:ribonuclease HI
MSEPVVWNIHIDGAARGNPGPAAYAFVLACEGMQDVEDKQCIGRKTNNQAEYTALVRALEKAAQLHAQRLVIHSDSELLVKQMKGEYRVKNEDLRSLYDDAKELEEKFEHVTFHHVPRSENRRADQLCNEALDHPGQSAPVPPKEKRRAATASGGSRAAAIREEAVHCLRAAAENWARGNPAVPSPEAVWDQLWSILEEQGVLRRSRPE